jgi:hypothetical protein
MFIMTLRNGLREKIDSKRLRTIQMCQNWHATRLKYHAACASCSTASCCVLVKPIVGPIASSLKYSVDVWNTSVIVSSWWLNTST